MSETAQKTPAPEQPKNDTPETSIVPDLPKKKKYRCFLRKQEVELEMEDGSINKYWLKDGDGDDRAALIEHFASLAKIDPVTRKPIGMNSLRGSDIKILSYALWPENETKRLTMEEIKALNLPGETLAELAEDVTRLYGLDTEADARAKKALSPGSN